MSSEDSDLKLIGDIIRLIQGPPVGAHVSAERLLAWMQGYLSKDEQIEAERHLSSCLQCAKVKAAMDRAAEDPSERDVLATLGLPITAEEIEGMLGWDDGSFLAKTERLRTSWEGVTSHRTRQAEAEERVGNVIGEIALRRWRDRWVDAARRLWAPPADLVRLNVAAPALLHLTLWPTTPGDDESYSLEIEEQVIQQGRQTRFVCNQTPAGTDSEWRYLSWRLFFDPTDEGHYLFQTRGLSPEDLGRLRLAHGEEAWRELLDLLVPVRAGTIDLAENPEQIVKEAMPGPPTGYTVTLA